MEIVLQELFVQVSAWEFLAYNLDHSCNKWSDLISRREDQGLIQNSSEGGGYNIILIRVAG